MAKWISGAYLKLRSFYLKFEHSSPKIPVPEWLRLRSARRSEKGGRRPGVWGEVAVRPSSSFLRAALRFREGACSNSMWLNWWI